MSAPAPGTAGAAPLFELYRRSRSVSFPPAFVRFHRPHPSERRWLLQYRDGAHGRFGRAHPERSHQPANCPCGPEAGESPPLFCRSLRGCYCLLGARSDVCLLTQFDKSAAQTFSTSLRAKCTVKGHLSTYRLCDEVRRTLCPLLPGRVADAKYATDRFGPSFSETQSSSWKEARTSGRSNESRSSPAKARLAESRRHDDGRLYALGLLARAERSTRLAAGEVRLGQPRDCPQKALHCLRAFAHGPRAM